MIDLGAGINGFSYNYFKKAGYLVHYAAVESIGQFVKLMNYYFKKSSFIARAFQMSLFEPEGIIKLIKAYKKPRIVFLFKVVDCLEMMQRDYSKKFLIKIMSACDFIVVSFATRSLLKRRKFAVNRNWFFKFAKENFKIVDDFKIGEERYVILSALS